MYNEFLKFNKNGKLKILVLTDIHEKPDISSEKGKNKSFDTFNFIETSIDKLKPDFIVLGGDNCTDYNSPEEFKEIFERVTNVIIKRKIPFGTVMGNHEHDTDEKMFQKIIKAYENCDYCICKNMTENIPKNLNYYIPIKRSDDDTDGYILWMIDSNNTIPVEDRIVYDTVHRNQLEWYENNAEKIKKENGGKTIRSIVFQHIPVQEIYNLLRPAKIFEMPFASKGHDLLKKNFYMKKKGCKGYIGEGPDIPYFNEGEFASWKKVGDVRGAFFGHDHMNDFDGTFDSIVMGQSKTSGFRAYTDGCRSGVRMIVLDENNPDEIETRMYHFKDFGLKSTSLGPIEKRITDRQSMNLHLAAKIGLGVLAVAAIIVAGVLIKHYL